MSWINSTEQVVSGVWIVGYKFTMDSLANSAYEFELEIDAGTGVHPHVVCSIRKNGYSGMRLRWEQEVSMDEMRIMIDRIASIKKEIYTTGLRTIAKHIKMCLAD